MIIGLGHKRERGKDTAAKIIYNRLKYKAPTRMDFFAYSLKEGIGKGVFGLSHDQLYGNLKNVVDPFWGKTPRQILQFMGTDVMRKHYGEDIWVKTVEKRWLESGFGEYLILSDVRFKNEADWVRDKGGYLIKINRNIEYNEEVDTHRSEIDLDDYYPWDAVIDNNGTLAELGSALSALNI